MAGCVDCGRRQSWADEELSAMARGGHLRGSGQNSEAQLQISATNPAGGRAIRLVADGCRFGCLASRVIASREEQQPTLQS